MKKVAQNRCAEKNCLSLWRVEAAKQDMQITGHQSMHQSRSVWDPGSKHTAVQCWNMDTNRGAIILKQNVESIQNELSKAYGRSNKTKPCQKRGHSK